MVQPIEADPRVEPIESAPAEISAYAVRSTTYCGPARGHAAARMFEGTTGCRNLGISATRESHLLLPAAHQGFCRTGWPQFPCDGA
jgi:hypothetical protein